MEPVASPTPHLVLDVDGVLQAPSLKYGHEQTRVITETHPTAQVHPALWPRRWHGYGAGRRRRDTITFRTPVRTSPDLLAGLAGLPAHPVMLTSWLEDGSVRFFLDQATRDGTRWFPDATLLPHPGRDTDGSLPYTWKLDALNTFLTGNPAPFIWADDDQVPEFRDTVDRTWPHLRHLLVGPDPDLGLTRAHVRQMRDFLDGLR